MTVQSKAIGESVANTIVQKRIEQLKKAGITFPKIAKELAACAFSNIQDFIEVDNGGEVIARIFTEVGEDKLKAVKAIKEKTRFTESADGQRLFKDSQFEYILYDKVDTLKYLVKLLGEEPAEEVNHTHELSPELEEMFETISKAGADALNHIASGGNGNGGNGNGNGKKKVKK